MKVFISWSGNQSRAVAEALWKLLPDIIQFVDPWVSGRSITAGARWTPEINKQLEETKFGIICLTHANQTEPWVLFEAGALAKTLEDTAVVPYLINMEPPEVTGPLAQFQAIRWDKEGTWELVKAINEALSEKALPEARLNRLFERTWPDLDAAFKAMPKSEIPPSDQRAMPDILREVLVLTRYISRQIRRGEGVDPNDIRALVNESISQARFTAMIPDADGLYYQREVEFYPSYPPYYPNVGRREEVGEVEQEGG